MVRTYTDMEMPHKKSIAFQAQCFRGGTCEVGAAGKLVALQKIRGVGHGTGFRERIQVYGKAGQEDSCLHFWEESFGIYKLICLQYREKGRKKEHRGSRKHRKVIFIISFDSGQVLWSLPRMLL